MRQRCCSDCDHRGWPDLAEPKCSSPRRTRPLAGRTRGCRRECLGKQDGERPEQSSVASFRPFPAIGILALRLECLHCPWSSLAVSVARKPCHNHARVIRQSSSADANGGVVLVKLLAKNVCRARLRECQGVMTSTFSSMKRAQFPVVQRVTSNVISLESRGGTFNIATLIRSCGCRNQSALPLKCSANSRVRSDNHCI
jgi:hypothetical protein